MIKQYSNNDCVPAQFINVLKYFYTDMIPAMAIETVYRQSFDIENGTSIYAIIHIAELLNYYTDLHFECYTSDFEAHLKDELSRNGIVMVVRTFNKNMHVVIVYKIENDMVKVFDSATKLDSQSYKISKLLYKANMIVCVRRENL